MEIPPPLQPHQRCSPTPAQVVWHALGSRVIMQLDLDSLHGSAGPYHTATSTSDDRYAVFWDGAARGISRIDVPIHDAFAALHIGPAWEKRTIPLWIDRAARKALGWDLDLVMLSDRIELRPEHTRWWQHVPSSALDLVCRHYTKKDLRACPQCRTARVADAREFRTLFGYIWLVAWEDITRPGYCHVPMWGSKKRESVPVSPALETSVTPALNADLAAWDIPVDSLTIEKLNLLGARFAEIGWHLAFVDQAWLGGGFCLERPGAKLYARDDNGLGNWSVWIDHIEKKWDRHDRWSPHTEHQHCYATTFLAGGRGKPKLPLMEAMKTLVRYCLDNQTPALTQPAPATLLPAPSTVTES